MEEMHGEGLGKGCRASISSLSIALSMCSLTWKFFKPYSFGFLWSLYYIGKIHSIIGYWWLKSTSNLSTFFPRGEEIGLKFPALYSHGWFSCQPASIPGDFQKLTCNKRHLCCLHSHLFRNSKGFWSSVPGTVDEDQIYVSYDKSQYHTSQDDF